MFTSTCKDHESVISVVQNNQESRRWNWTTRHSLVARTTCKRQFLTAYSGRLLCVCAVPRLLHTQLIRFIHIALRSFICSFAYSLARSLIHVHARSLNHSWKSKWLNVVASLMNKWMIKCLCIELFWTINQSALFPSSCSEPLTRVHYSNKSTVKSFSRRTAVLVYRNSLFPIPHRYVLSYVWSSII